MLSFFFLPLYFATAVAYVLWSGVFTIGSDYVYVCIARTIASSSDVSLFLLSLLCVYMYSWLQSAWNHSRDSTLVLYGLVDALCTMVCDLT